MTNFFDNAKTVMFNNKEVKTITTSNGGVIWEKEEEIPYITAEITGTSISFQAYAFYPRGAVTIDWGDETTSSYNWRSSISHTYSDGKNTHTITFVGTILEIRMGFKNNSNLIAIKIPNTVTNFEESFRNCINLTSINIPSSVQQIASNCFQSSGLISVKIPSSLVSLGINTFKDCNNLVDYQLYWKDSAILKYNGGTMPNNTNTVFTIPNGQTANYVANGYPSDKLVERGG